MGKMERPMGKIESPIGNMERLMRNMQFKKNNQVPFRLNAWKSQNCLMILLVSKYLPCIINLHKGKKY